MRIDEVYCDKCGKKLVIYTPEDKDIAKYSWKYGNNNSNELYADLCIKCKEKFDKHIREFFDEEEQMQIKFKKLSKDAKLPEYKTTGSAGMDVYSIENCFLHPLERRILKTGIAVEIPSGYEIQVRPRSGLACKEGISVINTPGTIDADYRGEIGICLVNLSNEMYPVKVGDRIAQLVVNKIEQPEIVEVDELDVTERGDGGFGSTGKN